MNYLESSLAFRAPSKSIHPALADCDLTRVASPDYDTRGKLVFRGRSNHTSRVDLRIICPLNIILLLTGPGVHKAADLVGERGLDHESRQPLPQTPNIYTG
ncbi:hypothetical protein CGLO_06733 [Colletotrichum gloeosporioides Cg-14]|uniref:Uncharacterized protein n=1 Tax=Colletotrichum gloeosporioides (strain Cg-14) TaxID=1237896 RepID=T0LP96_COLGC|nr:hypothetical protein CGLO_06733 [Colletotrichum gloeosporioides Cg-14]